MKVEIKIPTIGESITEAVIARILKANGSFVKEGDEILEMETDKVNQVIYAPQSGVLELSVKVDQKVKIGEIIGYIDSSKQAESAPAPVKATAQLEPSKASSRVFAQDVIKDLETPPKQESEAPFIPKPSFELPNTSRKKMSSLRKKIATKLVEVKNTTAMLTTFNEIDMSHVINIRANEQESFQKRYGVKLGFMSFFVKAVVSALKAIPSVNAMIDGDDIVSFSSYDIGIAVSTDKGLIVPVLKECDKKSYGAIENEIAAFAKKAREGHITIDDLRGGSFTITNGGTFGSLLSTPIINPPQSAILGMHSIVKRPVAVNDEIVICPMMYVALSYDHRIIDGKEAVLFLVHIKQNLEDPSRLLLDV